MKEMNDYISEMLVIRLENLINRINTGETSCIELKIKDEGEVFETFIIKSENEGK